MDNFDQILAGKAGNGGAILGSNNSKKGQDQDEIDMMGDDDMFGAELEAEDKAESKKPEAKAVKKSKDEPKAKVVNKSK